MKKYCVIPGIVYLESNVRKIPHFSFGEELRELGEQSEPKTLAQMQITVRFEVKKNNDIYWKNREDFKESASRFHYFWISGNNIYYERQLFPGMVYRMNIDLTNIQKPVLIVNKSYILNSFARVNNIFPPGAHLTDIILIMLLRKGFVAVSAAALTLFNEGIVLAGPPDTGKTTTVLSAIADKKHTYKIMSEDLCLLSNNGDVVSIPYTNSFRHYNNTSNPIGKLFGKLSKSSPVFSLLFRKFRGHMDTLFDGVVFESFAPLKHLYFLESNKSIQGFKIVPISESDKYRMLQGLAAYEFTFYRNPALLAASYFSDSINPQILKVREQTLLAQAVKNVRAFKIIASQPQNFYKALGSLHKNV